MWKQGELVEVEIVDLSDMGDGVGRSGEMVVFVPDTVVGDRALVRLVRVKPQYAFAKVKELLQSSPHRIRPSCIVADKCGGCQWQHIDYEYQLVAKRNQLIQALQRIGGFSQPPVDPVLPSEDFLAYRNKATYPVASRNGELIAGYYQKGTHQIVNLNKCPVQDSRLNPLLAKVKQDIQLAGWQPYDEQRHTGLIRHINLRIGRRTGEMLLTLVTKSFKITGVSTLAQEWLDNTPLLKGVMLNLNGDRTNAIFGKETRTVAGVPYLSEEFSGLEFQIRPETFFQINTETAEALLHEIIATLDLQGNEILLDTYCGIGTLILPLAKLVHQAIGLEIQPEAVKQAQINAQINNINNVTFHTGAVEKLLPMIEVKPDIVLLDPPRKGCDRTVIETLLGVKPSSIVYVSCRAATLARDLKLLCANGVYTLTRIHCADFFPQTNHVEAAAFLKLSDLVKNT